VFTATNDPLTLLTFMLDTFVDTNVSLYSKEIEAFTNEPFAQSNVLLTSTSTKLAVIDNKLVTDALTSDPFVETTVSET
jgi:hypothetical protein